MTAGLHRTFGDLLGVEPGDGDAVHVVSQGAEGFLYGGFTMAAAIRAAATTTADGLVPKSLHAFFLAFGTWSDFDANVTALQDTRAFSVRQVELHQGGDSRQVAGVTVSFHRPDAGPDRAMAPGILSPAPEELSPLDVSMCGTDTLDLRPLTPGVIGGGRLHPYWCRTRDALGDDPVVHASGLAFMSDYVVVFTPFEPGTGLDGQVTRTLEHSLWFHRPFRADEWLLFQALPLSISGGRYVSRGTVHDRTGTLVASFVQEGFLRPA